jgi:hypothetical protein
VRAAGVRAVAQRVGGDRVRVSDAALLGEVSVIGGRDAVASGGVRHGAGARAGHGGGRGGGVRHGARARAGHGGGRRRCQIRRRGAGGTEAAVSDTGRGGAGQRRRCLTRGAAVRGGGGGV